MYTKRYRDEILTRSILFGRSKSDQFSTPFRTSGRGLRGKENEKEDGEGRRAWERVKEKEMARARGLTLSSGSHPPDFSRSEEKHDDDGEKGRTRKRARIYKRDLLRKGGRLEPRRYNDWPAEANSPSAVLVVAPTNSLLSLRVFVCLPMVRPVGIRAHTHTQTDTYTWARAQLCFSQAMRGSRAFEPFKQSKYIWRISLYTDAAI